MSSLFRVVAATSNETTTTILLASTTTSTTFQKIGTSSVTTLGHEMTSTTFQKIGTQTTSSVTTIGTEMSVSHRIEGTWMISVADPRLILDDVIAKANFARGVKDSLSSLSEISAELIDVVLSLDSRRLQALRRKLAGGAIRSVYTINVPSSMVGAADSASTALTDASSQDITRKLTAALAETMTSPPVIEGIVATVPQAVVVGSSVLVPTTSGAPSLGPATTETPSGTPSATQEQGQERDGAHGLALSAANAVIVGVFAASWVL